MQDTCTLDGVSLFCGEALFAFSLFFSLHVNAPYSNARLFGCFLFSYEIGLEPNVSLHKQHDLHDKFFSDEPAVEQLHVVASIFPSELGGSRQYLDLCIAFGSPL